MNKKLLALSVAAALGAGVSVANAQSTGQTGNALVVPYYSVQNGNATLINIINTDTVRGKAVKVRFRGAQRSDDVFDFQVFLSPGDVWTANVSQGADGRAQLTTNDASCTLPASVNESFVTARLTGTDAEKAAGTREGYVEIINMGDVITGAQATVLFGGNATDPNNAARQALFTATKHVNGVAPCGAATLETVVDRNTVNADSALGREAGTDAVGRLSSQATGGLAANVTIINVAEAAAWSVEAVAAYDDTAVESRYWSQTASVYGGTRDQLYQVTLDGIFLSNQTTPAQYDFPDLSTPRLLGAGALLNQSPKAWYDQVNAEFLATTLVNEYITDDSIFAQTDWVMSMPTRRYAIEGRNVVWPVAALPVNNQYVFPAAAVGVGPGTAAVPEGFGDAADLAAAGPAQYYINSYLAPFRNIYNATLNCVTVANFGIFDREERTTTTGVVISPGEVTTLRLCGEVGVVSFNNAGASSTGAVGAMLTVNNANLPYADGWASITFANALPVIGNAFVKANNGGAGATNMNFGGVWRHR